jgi:hypothetical protein
MLLYVFLLFFLLTPGVLLTIPLSKSKLLAAFVHALVFTLIYHLTYKMVWTYFYGYEGMTSNKHVKARIHDKRTK